MDVFFVTSKLAGVLLTPSNLLLLVGMTGVALWRFAPRLSGIGRRIAFVAATMVVTLAILPVGKTVLAALEQRFPSLEDCTLPGGAQVSGIVLLGGGMSSLRHGDTVIDDLNEASDRVRYAAQLARSYPRIPIVVSGGQAFDRGTARSEADAMADLLMELGVAPERIIREAASQTTSENAALMTTSANDLPWLLVTSAFHMPRAVGSFEAAGTRVIAAPTDWRSNWAVSPLEFSASANLEATDLAAREIIGLVGYWITGRSSSILPGSQRACAR